ncbi:hypothetical protein [Mycolicibacterium sp. PDY-3]|uniref:hypothetical protein n=1 Tax=Mycolicibacterium sp. PDY-3 TaxID=3376069 RepID=UPI00379FEA43
MSRMLSSKTGAPVRDSPEAEVGSQKAPDKKSASGSGQVFADYISRGRELEFQRMQTLEARGARVSQTNLAVLTAFLAIAALFAEKFKPSEATPAAMVFLASGAAALVASLIYASLAHAGTSKIKLTSNATLELMVGKNFRDSDVQARFVAANRDADTVKSLYAANEKRAAHLEIALALQILFVIYLALAISVEVLGRLVIG